MSLTVTEFCSRLFLFRTLEEEEISRLLGEVSCESAVFSRGETVVATESYARRVGFLISGECEVVRTEPDGTEFPMNLLRPLDAFGILTLFSEKEDYPTAVRARKKCEILFFSKDDVFLLLQKSPVIAMNLITFLAGRIVFLNEKVATLAGGSAEDKLATLLLSEYKRSDSLTLPFNAKKTSEKLRLGRASVYRALSALSERGLIQYAEKQITILDPKGLERKSS